MHYTVCIQAAGLGKRLSICEGLHKALVPINKKAVLSRIIDLFPPKTEFIIIVGHKQNQIKSFLKIAYPEYNIKYINVVNYDGPGSGPGYSLLQARALVSRPFIFMACDTIVLERPPMPNYNWIGISDSNTSKEYLVAEIENSNVINYFDKCPKNFIYAKSKVYKKHDNSPFNAFIGLAGIYDYERFWDALERDKTLSKGEVQVTNGLRALVKKDSTTKTHKFTWIDTGTDMSYSHARKFFNDNFLIKSDEFLYKEKNKIIKFFLDPDKARKRYERTKFLNKTHPHTSMAGDNFIWYEYVKGTLISNTNNEKIFNDFLTFMETKLWSPKMEDKKQYEYLQKKADKFYKQKTLQRVNLFVKMNKNVDEIEWINNNLVASVNTLLKKVNWDNLNRGLFSNFHGDPQPENVIVKNENDFVLIDWREDFGDDLQFGDVYYDLGKIYHSLIITHKKIRANQFQVDYSDNLAFYKFSKRRNLMKYLKYFEKFIIEKGYELKKVKIISALIYLNIAPLHHYPYSHLLFFHGKLELQKLVK